MGIDDLEYLQNIADQISKAQKTTYILNPEQEHLIEEGIREIDCGEFMDQDSLDEMDLQWLETQ